MNLLECLVEQMKFGKVDDGQYNIDLVIFTHPSYMIEPNDQFIVFEINYN